MRDYDPDDASKTLKQDRAPAPPARSIRLDLPRFTLVGADAEHGKITLLDAEDGRTPVPDRIVSLVLAESAGADTNEMVRVADDLGAITTVPRKLGRGSGLKINDVFWTAFLNNAAFFSAGNKNFVTGADTALGIDGLTKVEQTFMDLVDSDGKPTGVMPAILLVPTALSAMGTQLYKSVELRDTTANTKFPVANPHQGKFRIEVSRYLSNALYTGNSAKAWYLLADPSDLPVVEMAFLNGSLLVSPAVRYDTFEIDPERDALYPLAVAGREDSRVTPRLGIVAWPTERFGAYFNYAQGFRAPSPTQVNQAFTNPAQGYTTIPNPSLRAETSETFEVGVRFRDVEGLGEPGRHPQRAVVDVQRPGRHQPREGLEPSRRRDRPGRRRVARRRLGVSRRGESDVRTAHRVEGADAGKGRADRRESPPHGG